MKARAGAVRVIFALALGVVARAAWEELRTWTAKEVFMVGGLLFVFAGLWPIYPPAAPIVVGGVMLGISIWGVR
jgi:hypothetical protein